MYVIGGKVKHLKRYTSNLVQSPIVSVMLNELNYFDLSALVIRSTALDSKRKDRSMRVKT